MYCIREPCLGFGFLFLDFSVSGYEVLLYIDMRKTNILWFLVAFIALVVGYNLVLKTRKEGYRGGGEHHGGGEHQGGGEHHGGGGNHVYHSYGGHGGYYGGYGDGYGNGYYGRDYGYDGRTRGDLITFYVLYPFLIFGAVAIFLSYRK